MSDVRPRPCFPQVADLGSPLPWRRSPTQGQRCCELEFLTQVKRMYGLRLKASLPLCVILKPTSQLKKGAGSRDTGCEPPVL